jgi:hypothetical protein
MCVFNICYIMFNPSEFVSFLKKPQYEVIERKCTNVLFTAIKIYLLALLIIGLISSLSTIILRAFIDLPIDETLTVPVTFKDHLWNYFILIAFISPLLEEVIFRLSLVFNPVNISLSISTLTSLIVHKISNGIISIIAFILIYLLINQLAFIYKSNFQSFWSKNFKYIFYSLSILFGLVHISNYNFFETYQYFIIPILIFPQLAIGFILSFTRIHYKKGFLICFIIHVLMNMVSVSISLLEYSHGG